MNTPEDPPVLYACIPFRSNGKYGTPGVATEQAFAAESDPERALNHRSNRSKAVKNLKNGVGVLHFPSRCV